eukprot:symbB.v1.2.032273.t1/scaffold3853.1/size49235/1
MQVADGGLASKHNQNMCFHPKHSHCYRRQIIKDDYILSVNGNSGIEKMKEHLFNAKAVHIHVVRNPPSMLRG